MDKDTKEIMIMITWATAIFIFFIWAMLALVTKYNKNCADTDPLSNCRFDASLYVINE